MQYLTLASFLSPFTDIKTKHSGVLEHKKVLPRQLGLHAGHLLDQSLPYFNQPSSSQPSDSLGILGPLSAVLGSENYVKGLETGGGHSSFSSELAQTVHFPHNLSPGLAHSGFTHPTAS